MLANGGAATHRTNRRQYFRLPTGEWSSIPLQNGSRNMTNSHNTFSSHNVSDSHNSSNSGVNVSGNNNILNFNTYVAAHARRVVRDRNPGEDTCAAIFAPDHYTLAPVLVQPSAGPSTNVTCASLVPAGIYAQPQRRRRVPRGSMRFPPQLGRQRTLDERRPAFTFVGQGYYGGEDESVGSFPEVPDNSYVSDDDELEYADSDEYFDAEPEREEDHQHRPAPQQRRVPDYGASSARGF